MKNYRVSIKVLSILAIIWSLGEIVLSIWSHKVSLHIGGVAENILLAYDIQRIIVYAMVLLTGAFGVIASIKKNVWKLSVTVGIVSLLVSIIIPVISRVPFDIASIVFSIMIPFGIIQMNKDENK